MSNEVRIVLLIGFGIVLHRLDRLGKQIEAVGVLIRAEVARTEDERSEISTSGNKTRSKPPKMIGSFGYFGASSARQH